MNGFLFDENLPARIRFEPSRPLTSTAVLGPVPADHRLAIVTKDADFSDRIMLSTSPPWGVHLRFGNLRRSDYRSLLAKVWPDVEALLPANKLVCVYRDRVGALGD